MLRPLRLLQRPLNVRYSVRYVRYENASILLQDYMFNAERLSNSLLRKVSILFQTNAVLQRAEVAKQHVNAAVISNTRPLQF